MILLRGTEQTIIQCIRSYAKVPAMYVLYLVQYSGEAENLDPVSHRLVEQSGKGSKYSRHRDDCPNSCHSGLSKVSMQIWDYHELWSAMN